MQTAIFAPSHYAQLHVEVQSDPMQLTVMDLIDKFKLFPQGYQYTITVIDLMINYTWCIPLHATEDEVVHTYLVNVYSTFGGSHKTL